jgi:hypothetical protein
MRLVLLDCGRQTLHVSLSLREGRPPPATLAYNGITIASKITAQNPQNNHTKNLDTLDFGVAAG